MKTRIVLTFDDLEFARLCGSASVSHASVEEYVREVVIASAKLDVPLLLVERRMKGDGR